MKYDRYDAMVRGNCGCRSSGGVFVRQLSSLGEVTVEVAALLASCRSTGLADPPPPRVRRPHSAAHIRTSRTYVNRRLGQWLEADATAILLQWEQ